MLAVVVVICVCVCAHARLKALRDILWNSYLVDLYNLVGSIGPPWVFMRVDGERMCHTLMDYVEDGRMCR